MSDTNQQLKQKKKGGDNFFSNKMVNLVVEAAHDQININNKQKTMMTEQFGSSTAAAVDSGTINISFSSAGDDEEAAASDGAAANVNTHNNNVRRGANDDDELEEQEGNGGGGGGGIAGSISNLSNSFRSCVMPVLVEKNSDIERNDDDDEFAASEQHEPSGHTTNTSTTTTAVVERETVLVNRSKIAVYLFLIVTAAVMAYATHKFMENEEAVWYYDEFEEFTEEVFETTSRRVVIAEQSLKGLSDLYTSLATASTEAQKAATDSMANFLSGAGGGETQLQLQELQEQFEQYHQTRPEQFYMFPSFWTVAQTVIETTPITNVLLCPLITDEEQRKEFETYAVQHQGWIERDVGLYLFNHHDHDHEGHNGNEEGGSDSDEDERTRLLSGHHHTHVPIPSIRPQIYNQDGTIATAPPSDDDDDDTSQPSTFYLPVSQVAPPPIVDHPDDVDKAKIPTILLDQMSIDWFPPLWEQMIETKQVVLSHVIDHHKEGLHDARDDHQHISVILQPIFSQTLPLDDINDMNDQTNSSSSTSFSSSSASSDDDDDESRGTIIGVIVGMLEWESLLTNILESEAKGMIIDIENTCFETSHHHRQSYEIVPDKGGGLKFLGENYQHDPSLKLLSERQKLFVGGDATDTNGSADSSSDDRRGRLRRSLGHEDEDTCGFYISTHGTQTYVNNWQRDDAVISMSVVIAIFVFTGLVFLVYDLMVQIRQRKVLSTAQKNKKVVAVLEDVVEERTKELETTNQQLELANQNIRAASALQLQHFACMSHEIRTPLNCIIGCASLLHQDNKLDPSQKESLDMMVTSGNLLLAVVDDVLDFSKLESGNVDIDISRTNLQEMLDAVIWSMQTKARHRDIVVDTKYDVLLPQFIQTDIRRIHQVLYNLIGNAVKFSNNNGTIEVAATVVDAATATTTMAACGEEGATTTSSTVYSPPISEELQVVQATTKTNHHASAFEDGKVEEQQQQKMIRFTVKDYGVGIAQDKFAKIFHPFLQESTDTETLYGGSGLGLAISSKLVHRLGGSISVDSELGKWTEFAVELSLEGASSTDDVDLSFLRDAKIYLVDADVLVQERMKHFFEHFEIEHQITTSIPPIHDTNDTTTKTPVYIIQEDLWTTGVQIPSNSILITTGNDYKVKNTHGHIRSLLQMVPINIMSCIVESIQSKRPSLEKLPSLAAEEKEEDEMVALESLAILIAEDNKINSKVLVRILNRLGIQNVAVAVNGKEAVDHVQGGNYVDVVLMDMQMPVMDGLEACTIIRNSALQKRPKVVFVTAHALGSYEDECYKAGATDFLSKPCNIESVKQVLIRTMKKRRSTC